MTTWYPGPLPESPAEIVEKKRLWTVYGPKTGRFIDVTPDPATAKHYADTGYLVEESTADGTGS